MCKQVPFKRPEESIAILFKTDLNLYDVNYFHPMSLSERIYVYSIRRRCNVETLCSAAHMEVYIQTTTCISTPFGIETGENRRNEDGPLTLQ